MVYLLERRERKEGKEKGKVKKELKHPTWTHLYR